LFYNTEGVKVVPDNIGDYFTAVSLAHWFMDDGYKTASGYLFCTESFSQKDLYILLSMLSSKFGLECSLHKTTNGPRLYIRGRSVSRFNELVKPHMVDCFLYKLITPLIILYVIVYYYYSYLLNCLLSIV